MKTKYFKSVQEMKHGDDVTGTKLERTGHVQMRMST
jgi:hypothetical protein